VTLKGAASGGQSLFGILLDGTPNTASSDRVGRFKPYMPSVSTPDETPTLDVSVAGAITNGGVAYKATSRDFMGNESAAGPASARSAAITSKKTTVDLTDTAASYGAVGFNVYRSHTREDASVTPYYYIGSTFDATDTTFEDNVATDEREIDQTRTAPSTNGSGTEAASESDQACGPNFGFAFVPRSAAAVVADYGRIDSDEYSSAEGETESAPGPIEVSVEMGAALRSGLIVPILNAGIGRWTTKQGMVSAALTTDDGLTAFDEPTRRFTWETDESVKLGRSFSALDYPGGAAAPELCFGLMATGLSFSVQKGALVNETVSMMGLHHTLHAIGYKSSGTGTATGRPYLMGQRNDVTSTTDIYCEIQTAATGGVMIVRLKIGSGASYSQTISVAYDTTDGKQKTATNALVPRVEALDESGNRLGLDTEEARYPVWLCFSGDVRDYDAGDVYILKPTALVPGEVSGNTSYTQIRPLVLQGPRFGTAHTNIYRGSALVAAQSLDYALTIPNVPYEQLGSPSYAPTDFDFAGKLEAEIKFGDRFNSRDDQARLRKNEKLDITIVLEGERILVKPGTRSTKRHRFSVQHTRCVVTDVSIARSEGVNIQTVTCRAAQPNSGPWGIFESIGNIDWRDPG
jgi:hypothetical protein